MLSNGVVKTYTPDGLVAEVHTAFFSFCIFTFFLFFLFSVLSYRTPAPCSGDAEQRGGEDLHPSRASTLMCMPCMLPLSPALCWWGTSTFDSPPVQVWAALLAHLSCTPNCCACVVSSAPYLVCALATALLCVLYATRRPANPMHLVTYAHTPRAGVPGSQCTPPHPTPKLCRCLWTTTPELAGVQLEDMATPSPHPPMHPPTHE